VSDCSCGSPGFNSDGDGKVKITSSDTTADFLASKLVAGTNVTLVPSGSGTNQTLTVNAAGTALDHKVSISATDTTPNYLSSKLVSANVTNLTILNGGANETLQISLSAGANGNVLATTGGVPTWQNIVNANVDAAAAIAVTKLASSATNGQVLTTIAGVPTWSSSIGDAAIATFTISASAVLTTNFAGNQIDYIGIATTANTIAGGTLLTGLSARFITINVNGVQRKLVYLAN